MADNTEEGTAAAGDNTEQTQTEFEAITSQEAFDQRIQQRIARERGKFADYDELKAKAEASTTRAEALATENSTLAEKVQEFQTASEQSKLVAEIAAAKDVPAGALRGSTREELEAHADTLHELLKPSGPVIPGQERTPQVKGDPVREFTKNLFDKN